MKKAACLPVLLLLMTATLALLANAASTIESSGTSTTVTGQTAITGGYYRSGNDEIYGNAQFKLNSDSTIDRKSPIRIEGWNSWACFDSKRICARNMPASFDLIFGDRPSVINEPAPVSIFCIECPYEKLQRNEVGQNYFFLTKATNSKGYLASAAYLKGKILATFGNVVIEGKHDGMLYKIINEGDGTDIKLETPYSYWQIPDKKELGRILSAGRWLIINYNSDQNNPFQIPDQTEGEFTPPQTFDTSNYMFLNLYLFNQYDISLPELSQYLDPTRGTLKITRDTFYNTPYSNIPTISYLEPKNPRTPYENDAQYQRRIRAEAIKYNLGENHLLRLSDRNKLPPDINTADLRGPTNDKVYEYGQKFYAFITAMEESENNQWDAYLDQTRGLTTRYWLSDTVFNPENPTTVHYTIKYTLPETQTQADIEQFYAITPNAVQLFRTQEENYREVLENNYRRQIQQTGQNTEREMAFLEPTIFTELKINELRNLLDDMNRGGNVFGISDLKRMTSRYSHKRFLVDNKLDAEKAIRYHGEILNGLREINSQRQRGRFLNDIYNAPIPTDDNVPLSEQEKKTIDEVRKAFAEPNMQFLYKLSIIDDAIDSGRPTLFFNEEQRDVSTKEAVTGLILEAYLEAAGSLRGSEDYEQSNKYVLGAIELLMEQQDFQTFLTATQQNPDDFKRVIMLSDIQLYPGYPDIGYFISEPYYYIAPKEIRDLVYDENRLSRSLLKNYVDNKADLEWENSLLNTNPGIIANMILPSNHVDAAMMALPPTPMSAGRRALMAPKGKVFSAGLLKKGWKKLKPARIPPEKATATAGIDRSFSGLNRLERQAIAQKLREHGISVEVGARTALWRFKQSSFSATNRYSYERLVYDLSRDIPYGKEPPGVHTAQGIDVYTGFTGAQREKELIKDLRSVMSKILSGRLTDQHFESSFASALAAVPPKTYYRDMYNDLKAAALRKHSQLTTRTVERLPYDSSFFPRTVTNGDEFVFSSAGRPGFKITIDNSKDPELMNFLYAEAGRIKAEQQGLRLRMEYVLSTVKQRLESNRDPEALEKLYQEYAAKQETREPIPLGEFIKRGTGNCEQKSALISMLAQFMGYESRMVEGHIGLGGGAQTQKWVEVKTSGRHPLIVDCVRGVTIYIEDTMILQNIGGNLISINAPYNPKYIWWG
ncbi:transglutaminase domain-containing protein [Candidatus Woesearchaeota archaeon]|nr:transglutaminase domain-containing protein [Candidatus Woesearchaeota archaeon]